MGVIFGSLNSDYLGMKPNMAPTFPPQKGFAKARPKRGTKAPTEVLASARIPLKYRDYCADHLLDYQVCRHRYFPFLTFCSHERHEYLHCEMKDYVLRMKEFERERRIREKEFKKKDKR